MIVAIVVSNNMENLNQVNCFFQESRNLRMSSHNLPWFRAKTSNYHFLEHLLVLHPVASLYNLTSGAH